MALGRDCSVLNDPHGEPGCTPLYVGLLSTWDSVDGDLIFFPFFFGRAPYRGPRQIEMNELTIHPGDEASLTMGTLMGDMEGGTIYRGLKGKGAENSGDGSLLLRGPVGEPVELLTEYFWRAPDGEHLSLWELC